jgi:excisionase family DNA binding protein
MPGTTPEVTSLEALPPVLRVGEVADFLRCDRSKVYELVRRGDLPVIRLGRSFRVSREVLGRFLEASVRGPGEPGAPSATRPAAPIAFSSFGVGRQAMSHPDPKLVVAQSGGSFTYAEPLEVRPMLTFVVEGETHQVSAHHFSELVAVAVRLMRDAAKGTGVGFNVAGLHASNPTIDWQPVSVDEDTLDVDSEFDRIVSRIHTGIGMLEREATVPEWMAETTARQLHEVARWFGETEVDGLTFRSNGHRQSITRESYLTLDRWLHEESEAIGSVTGTLITATLHGGPHVNVKDELYERVVHVRLTRDELREAGQWIGLRVTASGRMKRDFAGRPKRIASGTIELVPEAARVTTAEAAGLFRSGPAVVAWLDEQRDG